MNVNTYRDKKSIDCLPPIVAVARNRKWTDCLWHCQCRNETRFNEVFNFNKGGCCCSYWCTLHPKIRKPEASYRRALLAWVSSWHFKWIWNTIDSSFFSPSKPQTSTKSGLDENDECGKTIYGISTTTTVAPPILFLLRYETCDNNAGNWRRIHL